MRFHSREPLGVMTLLTVLLGMSLVWQGATVAQNGGPTVERQKQRATPRERRKRRIEVSRVGLDLSRVPGEEELRAAGQVAGLLDPASPADHKEAVDAKLLTPTTIGGV